MMQDAVVMESALESQVSTLSHGGGASRSPGVGREGATFLVGDGSLDWLPLYLCLGSPAYSGSHVASSLEPDRQLALEDHSRSEVSLPSLEGIDDSDRDFADEETWLLEDREDLYSAEQLAAEQRRAQEEPRHLSELYWTARWATRKYRAARRKVWPTGQVPSS